MTVESISPRQFATYMLLVETADEPRDIALKLGISRDALSERMKSLYDMFGVSTRLELMTQYHYREQHPGC